MGFDYTRPQATAQRLIEKFGQSITISRNSGGAYVPATGVVSGDSTTTQTVWGCPLPGAMGKLDDSFRELLTKGKLRFFLISPLKTSGAALDFEPESGDILAFGGGNWEVIGNTPLNPAGTPVLHQLICQVGGS